MIGIPILKIISRHTACSNNKTLFSFCFVWLGFAFATVEYDFVDIAKDIFPFNMAQIFVFIHMSHNRIMIELPMSVLPCGRAKWISEGANKAMYAIKWLIRLIYFTVMFLLLNIFSVQFLMSLCFLIICMQYVLGKEPFITHLLRFD